MRSAQCWQLLTCRLTSLTFELSCCHSLVRHERCFSFASPPWSFAPVAKRKAFIPVGFTLDGTQVTIHGDLEVVEPLAHQAADLRIESTRGQQVGHDDGVGGRARCPRRARLSKSCYLPKIPKKIIALDSRVLHNSTAFHRTLYSREQRSPFVSNCSQ